MNGYELVQGMPTKALTDNGVINAGGRKIEVLHTSGYFLGHLCFWEKSRGYLLVGDWFMKIFCLLIICFVDPAAYLDSLAKVSALHVKKVFPAHSFIKYKA